jgi:peptide/nickel transport system substrate-binding protein
VDDLRAAGERQVGDDRTTWEQADSRLFRRARARAAAGPRRRRLAPGLALAGALSAFSCTTPAAPPAPREPITLTIGVPQSRQLDPTHGAPAVAEVLAFERLTTNDPEGRTRPLLLEGWSVSADGLVWRLMIRPGVRFQDGSPLTAADVKRTFDYAIASPAVAATAVCVPSVASVDVGSEREVVVALKRRCSYLLDDLDRAITRTAADGKTRIGTGAFAITSSTADVISLEANRHYYAGPPAIDRVEVKPFDALRTAWADMMRGRVDFLWEVGPDTAEFLSDRTAVEVRSYLGYYAIALMLNSARPPFQRSEARRALNLAVDRAALVQQGLKGHGVAADGPIWPRYWARDPRAPAIRFNAGEADALVRAARLAPGGFTCLVPANFSILERMALLVQQQLAGFGIRMRLESLPPDVFNRRILSGEFDAVMLSALGGPSATVFHRFWHSAGATKRWNFWGYRNSRVDQALDTALDAPGDVEFAGAIRQFEAAARDDPPAVFLAWSETMQAVSRRFAVPPGNDGRDAIYVLSRWFLRPAGRGAP